MIPYLELSLRSRGLRVVAGVGDAPILTSPRGAEVQARAPVNWWLQPEGNYVSVQVEPVPDSPDAPAIDLALCFPKDDRPPLCRVGFGVPRGTALPPSRMV